MLFFSLLNLILILQIFVRAIECQLRLDLQRGIQKARPHEQFSKKFNSKSKFSQNITNIDFRYYYVKISLGTPPIEFKMKPDIGSGDTWVYSSWCQTNLCRSRTRWTSTSTMGWWDLRSRRCPCRVNNSRINNNWRFKGKMYNFLLASIFSRPKKDFIWPQNSFYLD